MLDDGWCVLRCDRECIKESVVIGEEEKEEKAVECVRVAWGGEEGVSGVEIDGCGALMVFLGEREMMMMIFLL